MTIKQFQELYFIASNNDADIDKSVKMVGVVMGITPEQVDKMPMAKFNKVCAKIQKKFEIFNIKLMNGKPKKGVRVNGRTYQLHYRIDKKPIDAARYVEVVSFGKDVVANLHKIMASISQPVNWRGSPYTLPHDEIAADFEHMDFEAAYHAAVFFYLQYQVSMKIIQPYLIRELKAKGMEAEKVEEILTTSLLILDGFQMPKWSQNLKPYLLNRFGI